MGPQQPVVVSVGAGVVASTVGGWSGANSVKHLLTANVPNRRMSGMSDHREEKSIERELLMPLRWDLPRWNAAIACWLGIYLFGFPVGLAILDAELCPDWVQYAFVIAYLPVFLLIALIHS